MMSNKTITVELENPIEYSLKGNVEQGTFLEIAAPTGKIAALIGIVKAEIGKATKKNMESMESLKDVIEDAKNADKDEKELSNLEEGDGIFMMLTMGGADMSVIMVTFRDILKQSAKVEGEGNFTTPLFDKMDYDDIEIIIKNYLGAFMKAS